VKPELRVQGLRFRMKPALKAPGTKRLKLYYDERPSNFAFKSNLRRYAVAALDVAALLKEHRAEVKVGRCRLTLSSPC